MRALIWVLVPGLAWTGSARAGEVHFVDVAARMGIDFVHDNGASPQKRLPETSGSGVAFFDFDGDGDQDLYLVNSGDMVAGRRASWNALYRNDGRRFVDLAAEAGARGEGFGMGVAAADFDNDGDQDLYLSSWGEDMLLRNEGGRFSQSTRAAGLGNEEWGTSAAFLDYDNDGDLDLYVANYVQFRLGEQPWCGREDLNLRFYCDPRQFRPTVDRLFRNEGEGTFVDIGRQAGIVRPGNGLGVVCSDFDEDGDQDIYVADDLTPNLLYENRGGGRFEEIGLLAGTALNADGVNQAGMGVDAGDYDNDGDQDLFVTNYQLENNDLYRNDGSFFVERSAGAGVAKISLDYLGFGTGFFDYDNDGWLDLFVANGHVHDNIEEYDALVTYAQRAQIFHNESGGRFVDRTGVLGRGLAPLYVGRGSAFGDFDADGDLDIVLANSGRRTVLLRNEGGNANHWLQVKLQGGSSNRDGVGARLVLQAGALTQVREIRAGSGYLSTSEKTAFFGLGTHQRAERLEIHWPSGRLQVLEGVAADQVLRLVEE